MPDNVPPPTFIAPQAPGLVPRSLAIRTRKLFLENFDLHVDIGFHEFEIGTPQILRINVEVWVDADHFPRCDTVEKAWDYDFLRTSVLQLVAGRRFNLQETVVHAIYDLVAARAGVAGLRVSTRKPDVYPDCQAVGVELASF
ncbi:dihydroneopterin aldolase [Sandarakinorhabdus sp.]|uniref:dihydroneopterin aldolase n=1 Tax=Sandarakinorhabdus sp. TaxID=1916663 RepID=UPI00334215DF